MKKIFCLTIVLLFSFCLFSCGDSKYPVKEEQITVISKFDENKTFSLTLNVGSQETDIISFFTVRETLDELHNLLKTNESFYDFDGTDIRFLKDGYFYTIELVAKEKNHYEYILFNETSMVRFGEEYYQIPFPRNLGAVVTEEFKASSQCISYLDSYFSKCANITRDSDDQFIVSKVINFKEPERGFFEIVITKMDGKFVFSLKGDSNDNSK